MDFNIKITIHHDQVELISDIPGLFDIWKFTKGIHHTNSLKKKKNSMLTSFDKEFDKI